MSRPLSLATIILIFFLGGCGTSGDVFSPQNGITSSNVPLNLRFVNEDEELPLNRLPAADTFTVQVYNARGSLLLEESFSRTNSQVLNGIPAGPILVRLLVSRDSAVIGYSDRSIDFSAANSVLTFDTLLTNAPPPPEVDLSPEPRKLGFLTHPRDVNVGQSQVIDVVVLSGAGERVVGFAGDVELTSSTGDSFALQALTGL